ncbi:sugar phosphate isomerase/epimerase family protein [Nonomuraea sp. H19]|uniref:sugar phosphate isomerase/epimerase family protein n=1 Tax=Nonomuraea sp. H19 TaxID=3452206 RepID=UPI003F8B825F
MTLSSTSPLYATRLNSFALGEGTAHPAKKLPTTELIQRAGRVKGLDALELNFPEHFLDVSASEVKAATDAAGLQVTGLQLRWPASDFARGAFTNADPGRRAQAVQVTKEAVDVARDLGAGHVILWPAHDGYEYPMQLDYARAWDWLCECYSEVAAYGHDLDMSIEYKPAEPRARTLLSTTGSVLTLIAEVQRPNLGVTLDFAHLLMAQENPAQSIALCLRQGLLKGLQLNDGYAKADDGLMVASVHLVETLEAFFYLVRDGYAGTFYFDTDPIREDPLGECEMNIARAKQLLGVARKLVADATTLPDADALAGGAAWWKALVANGDH